MFLKNKDSKIYIAGHRGLAGSAICRQLEQDGYHNLLTRTRAELDLTNQSAVEKFFSTQKPDYVFLAAAKVGGILANNTYPADFIRDNLLIQTNVIDRAYRNGIKKLLFLGSSCIYPRDCPQPIKEEYLLTGPLEETNKAYAAAKIIGIIQCQSYNQQYGTNFISVMPTNLYGPGHNFNSETSHVLPALIRKLHEAKIKNDKEVMLWGTGSPKREFLYVDDLAKACIFLMNNYDDSEIINIGTGEDISIHELAEKIKKIVDYKGKVNWDTTKPDGTPRKLLNVKKINVLGWKSSTPLDKGLKLAYEYFVNKFR